MLYCHRFVVVLTCRVEPQPRKQKSMRAITLASQKGGTGKSTLCIGLAVAAMEDGERVFMLETDRQGTISNWAARRASPEPVVERITHRFQLERALRGFKRRGCTLAIIDTPGSDNDFVTDAIRAANLCLVPARPSQADIEATLPQTKATAAGSSSPRNRDLKSESYCLSLLIRKSYRYQPAITRVIWCLPEPRTCTKKFCQSSPPPFRNRWPLALIATAVPQRTDKIPDRHRMPCRSATRDGRVC